MELHFKVAILCVGWFFWFRFISCENHLGESSTLKWTCLCAGGPLGALNYTTASNCSTSCDCVQGNPDGVWNCSCASEGTSQSPGNIHPASCFTACNCTSGTSTGATKHLSHKGVVVILLLCVAFTTIAFLTSIACYFYRKDQFSLPSPSFSSEKNTSWNSMTNLINHRSTSFPQCQAKNNTGFDGLTGFIRRLFWVFGSERGTFLGAIVQFSYVELEQATNKFSSANLIGIGGSSNVYRGHLKDGRVVAVKRLRSLGWPEADSEFLSEIELLSRLNHCHVVPLLGYCSESQGKQSERLLVFEYMSNGNLRDCLDAAHEKDPLDWETRVQIAIGAARGLEYLHEAAAPRILHRDIKSTNILLDDKYRAKITDLGMAKRLMADDLTSCSSSPARMLGTFGYFAPEYAIVGKASLKSDVFSFGVVILELITGRQAIHKSSNKGDESLVIWSTSSSGIKVITGIERSQGPVERLEPSRAASERWHARCSLPITIDRNLCEDHQKNTEMVLAAEYMERLILLTSNVQNRRSSDEETVDLTEPRFESFMQANVQSL
uniref:non-specific serine/threonine protein kinase n=1 Tax=Elaeis guineensis var. tenera TaxID=51953 RepID=A0A8N4F487_ELAGV|nr:receptor-like serine/threonine-protein kinase NCRK isoform X3 [Elaeis guineensis]